MSEIISFYYDFVSPPTYLAYKQLPRLVEAHGITIDYRPMFLAGLHQSVGHKAAVVQGGSKVAWMLRDLGRTARRVGVELNLNPNFPFLTVGPMRGALLAKDRGEIETYNRVLFDAVWRDQRNPNEPEVFSTVLSEAGLDPESYLSAIRDPRIKERLKQETEQARETGVFGSPTFIVKGELVFGQDRLHVVEEILSE